MGGHKIDEMQRKADVKDAELARRLKTNQTQLLRLKAGDRRLTLDWLRRIASALHCSVADLLSDDDAPLRVGPKEQELLSQLVRRGKGEASDLLELLGALDRIVSHEVERRHTRMALGPHSSTPALADLWISLPDRERARVLEIVRLALPGKSSSVRAA